MNSNITQVLSGMQWALESIANNSNNKNNSDNNGDNNNNNNNNNSNNISDNISDVYYASADDDMVFNPEDFVKKFNKQFSNQTSRRINKKDQRGGFSISCMCSRLS